MGKQTFENYPALASWIERLGNTPCLPLGDWMVFIGALNHALDAARAEGQPSGPDGLAERDEMLSWLDVSIVRLNGCHDLGEVNLRNKYIRLRALLAAPSTRLHEGQAT